jgi:hypothetical protein
MSLKDYPVSEKQQKREAQLVREHAEKGNWPAVARLIGGSPREDLQDFIPGFDDGEGPVGAPNFM